MGHWQDKIVYYRDFAYNSNRRRIFRMASISYEGNIGDASAKTFAEYVDPIHIPSDESDGDGVGEGQAQHGGQQQRRHSRPPLTHRFNSEKLHVQAYAKSLRKRLLSGPLVEVYVGDSKRHWSLHQNLLCHYSPYLQAELQPPHENATGSPASKKKGASDKENRLDLPDEDPSGFELLVKWLYQGKIEDVSLLSEPNEKYYYAVACYKLYSLCDRLEMPVLKNMAIDQYRKGLNEAGLVPDAEEISQIYRKSAQGSPFRRLMVKIAARQIMDPDSEKDAESYRSCFDNNSDFAVEMVNAIKLGAGGMLFEDPTEGDECEYHDHDNGPDCHIRGKGRSLDGFISPPRTETASSYHTAVSNVTPTPAEQQSRQQHQQQPSNASGTQRPAPPSSPPVTPPRSRRPSPTKLNNAATHGLPNIQETPSDGGRPGRSQGARSPPGSARKPPKLQRRKSPDAG